MNSPYKILKVAEHWIDQNEPGGKNNYKQYDFEFFEWMETPAIQNSTHKLLKIIENDKKNNKKNSPEQLIARMRWYKVVSDRVSEKIKSETPEPDIFFVDMSRNCHILNEDEVKTGECDEGEAEGFNYHNDYGRFQIGGIEPEMFFDGDIDAGKLGMENTNNGLIIHQVKHADNGELHYHELTKEDIYKNGKVILDHLARNLERKDKSLDKFIEERKKIIAEYKRLNDIIADNSI